MIQRSLQITGKRKMKWHETELPGLNEDEVLIKTVATAISIGAELPQYQESDWTNPFPVYPRKVGYESYGEILQIGSSVTSFQKGDKVIAFYGHKNFGVVKADKVFRVPGNINYKIALLAILSCDAAKGTRKLDPSENDKVIITGLGTMGLLAAYYLKSFYNVQQVDVIEPNINRWEIAKSFGINEIYSSDAYPKDHYEFGIECSATNQGFASLQKALKSQKEICILSDGNKETLTLQPEFFEKELRIVGSSDGWDYERHMEWFYEVALKTPFVNEIYQYEINPIEIIECFKELDKGEINPIKILVCGW